MISRAFLASLAGMCVVLAGCASATDVTVTDKPGTYEISASATGGRLAWTRAHNRAVAQARDYCVRQGMQVSVKLETTQSSDSLIRFECHPTF